MLLFLKYTGVRRIWGFFLFAALCGKLLERRTRVQRWPFGMGQPVKIISHSGLGNFLAGFLWFWEPSRRFLNRFFSFFIFLFFFFFCFSFFLSFIFLFSVFKFIFVFSKKVWVAHKLFKTSRNVPVSNFVPNFFKNIHTFKILSRSSKYVFWKFCSQI